MNDLTKVSCSICFATNVSSEFLIEQFAINDWTGATGTYSIGTTGNPNIAAYNTGTSGTADIIGTSGIVIVTKVDNTSYTNGSVVTASFNFTAGSYTISSGSFKVFAHC